LRLFSRAPASSEPTVRLFFATDIHGSDFCFRKFLGTVKHYRVDHLVLGGDITGKFLVPIIRDSSGRYRCRYGDRDYADLGDDDVKELKRTIRRFGAYPVVGAEDELAPLDDEEQREQVFQKLLYESLSEWVELAEDRLRGTGHRLFVAPGNDDFLELDAALKGSDVVTFAENQCLAVDEFHEMITTGYSNPTPWDTPRELSEDDLGARIDGMLRNVRDRENLIAVLHPPPYDTRLDGAPKINSDFELQKEFGEIGTMPVGSHAVRRFIEEAQPLLTLHGHVHEGRGVDQIGRTVCINPGSEYTEGVLNGVLLQLAPGRIISRQLVSG
jgi:Icc-related predicted phosphoesterase